jgi:glycosyltransferase involved in cell wall biosynthesis
MANAMARRGHRVTLFSPCGPSEGAEYQTVTVPVGRHLRTFAFAWNLRQIDLRPFDILHAHGDDYWLWGGNRPPHVRTMHGSCLAEAAHVPGLWEKLRMAMLGLSEILATRVADRTVCVSANTQRYYPWTRQVIMNGVDTRAFHPEAEKESRPTILFVGTYHNRKRGKLLAEQFQRVIRPALPDAQLWMVCSDAPEAPGVTVFGRVSLEKLADLYRKAWVFCLPSSYEGFGVPYIEAMASGTPVVATPNVGAREVLADGKYGDIVSPANLGTTLLELLTNPDRRQEMTRAGLLRARDFDWDRIAHEYEQTYNELLSNRREVPLTTS